MISPSLSTSRWVRYVPHVGWRRSLRSKPFLPDGYLGKIGTGVEIACKYAASNSAGGYYALIAQGGATQ